MLFGTADEDIGAHLDMFRRKQRREAAYVAGSVFKKLVEYTTMARSKKYWWNARMKAQPLAHVFARAPSRPGHTSPHYEFERRISPKTLRTKIEQIVAPR